MRVLLFTHSQDIDGVGCAILANKAFVDLEIVPTKTFDINENVRRFIEDESIYTYDKIFVTDLCLKESMLAFINEDEILKNRFQVIDHHKSEIASNKYDFVDVCISINGEKQSGTSLFYKYLLKHGYLRESDILNEFVELTREYDIWEWKNRDNYNAKKLHILFEMLGYDVYFNLINKKLNSLVRIEFSNEENEIIDCYENTALMEIKCALDKINIITINIDGELYKVGYINCLYKYRNDVNEFIQSNGNVYEIDIIGMVIYDMEVVVYRQVNICDVSKIACLFGGKGQFSSASNPQDNVDFINMMKENNSNLKLFIG